MAHEERRRSFGIQVLASDYSVRSGTIADYESASVTWQYLGTGTASLVAPERGLMLHALKCNTQVVPITFKTPGLPRWTGRVVAASAVKESRKVGQVQATLVDERKWLQHILAAPVPTSPWSNQTGSAHDTRTGPLKTVAKGYIQANVTRLANEGYPTPIVVAPTIGADTSPTVTLKARAKMLDEVLNDTLRFHGYDVTITLWLPGDEQPNGMSLTAPTLVADVVQGRSQPYVRFTDEGGGVRKRTLTVSHPQSLGAAVGGPGELVARIFQKVMATDGRVAALGKWGFPEIWLDATDADTAAVRSQRGLEKLGETAGKAAVTAEVDDRSPWSAGPTGDYWIGDLVRAEFSGVAVADRIDRVSVTDNAEGFRVMPTFGASRDTETSDVRIARTVAQMVRRLASIEAGR